MTQAEIKQLIQKQRTFFHSDATLDVEYRIHALQKLKESVQTLEGIEGLLCVEMEENLTSGYDLVFYSEFENLEALKNFQNHSLHEAHKKRCRNLVCERLCGDIER